MSDIFISYAEEDRATAKSLAELLRQRGWSVWWDRVIPIGKTFDRVIEEALDSTKCVLVLWSKSSVASHWVMTEANEGLNRGVLIPVKIEETKIPLGFRRLQTANLVGWQAGQENPEVSLMLDAITRTAGAPSVPSKSELGNELKLSKTPKAGAAQTQTVFQQELLQLIEYAKNRFRDIRGDEIVLAGFDSKDIRFDSSFSISGSTLNRIWRGTDGKYFFDSAFIDNAKEQKARAIFEERSSEIKLVLDRDWAVEEKENLDDILIRALRAVNSKDGLRISMKLTRISFSKNTYMVGFTLYEQ